MLVGGYETFQEIHEVETKTYKTKELRELNQVQTLKRTRNKTKNTHKWSNDALHQKQSGVHSSKDFSRERHQCVRK